MNIGKNIKALRRNNKMSQEELADEMNINRSLLSKWEKSSSEPKISDAVRISEIFKINIEKLVFDNIEEVAFDFGKNIEKMKQLNTAPSNNMREEYLDKERAIPLINPGNIEAYKAFEEAYKLNIHMESTGDDSGFVEMMTLYERAFDNGIIEAAINILNVVIGLMINIKSNTPEHDLIFGDVLIKYIEELEEASHPAGKFFRVYALGNGLLDNDKSQDENLDDGVFLMNVLAQDRNKYAENFINYIESLEEYC